MGSQVSPAPTTGTAGWDWGAGGVLSQRDLEAMVGGTDRDQEPDCIDRLGYLCTCVCCLVAGVLTTMGLVTALVAWVKFSWNHV